MWAGLAFGRPGAWLRAETPAADDELVLAEPPVAHALRPCAARAAVSSDGPGPAERGIQRAREAEVQVEAGTWAHRFVRAQRLSPDGAELVRIAGRLRDGSALETHMSMSSGTRSSEEFEPWPVCPNGSRLLGQASVRAHVEPNLAKTR